MVTLTLFIFYINLLIPTLMIVCLSQIDILPELPSGLNWKLLSSDIMGTLPLKLHYLVFIFRNLRRLSRPHLTEGVTLFWQLGLLALQIYY